jgi:hypothetical protein
MRPSTQAAAVEWQSQVRSTNTSAPRHRQEHLLIRKIDVLKEPSERFLKFFLGHFAAEDHTHRNSPSQLALLARKVVLKIGCGLRVLRRPSNAATSTAIAVSIEPIVSQFISMCRRTFGLTASVHQRRLRIAPAAVWCNAC